MIKNIFFIVVLIAFSPFVVKSQSDSACVKFVQQTIADTVNDHIIFDTLTVKGWKFIIPHKNGDILISQVLKDINKDIYRYKQACKSKGDDIYVECELKKYKKNKILSIITNTYIECNPMPSSAYSNSIYNYIFMDHHVYRITIKENDANFNKIVDTIVYKSFDEECLQYSTVYHTYYHLFIKNSFFIKNPFHSKVCDEDIEVKDAVNYLIFTKVD